MKRKMVLLELGGWVWPSPFGTLPPQANELIAQHLPCQLGFFANSLLISQLSYLPPGLRFGCTCTLVQSFHRLESSMGEVLCDPTWTTCLLGEPLAQIWPRQAYLPQHRRKKRTMEQRNPALHRIAWECDHKGDESGWSTDYGLCYWWISRSVIPGRYTRSWTVPWRDFPFGSMEARRDIEEQTCWRYWEWMFCVCPILFPLRVDFISVWLITFNSAHNLFL